MAKKDEKNELNTDNDEFRLKLYEQNCSSYRYQDALRWSRFKVAMTIEALILTIGFTNTITIVNSSNLIRGTLLLILSFLVHIIFTLARKDSKDSEGYEKRIKIFEESLKEKIGKKELEFKTSPVKFLPLVPKMRGEDLMKTIIWIISILNIIITLCWYLGWIFPGLLFNSGINPHPILSPGF